MKKMILLLAILVALPTLALADVQLQITSATTPSSIVPGNDGYVELSISNVGTVTADSLKVEVVGIDSPLKATSTSLESLGSLGIGESKSFILRFTVPSSAPSGFYVIRLKVSSCGNSICTDRIENALITVQTPSSLKVESVTPNELKIGQNTTVNVLLENIGGNLNNIILRWNSTKDILPYGSDNEEFIPYINKGQEYGVPLNIFVSQGVGSGVYPLDIELTYNDASGKIQTTRTSIGLVVSGSIDFVINLDTSNLAYNSAGIVDISIANRGTASANFLTVKASSKYGENEFYIGELEADDEDNVKLTQNLAGVFRPYNLDLLITYKDKFNNEYSENKTVEVQPKPASFPISIVVIVLIAAGGIYWWKKRKK